jgi:hypothetical protein
MWARRLALPLAFATLALVPRAARAYVREVTNSGLPVAWHYPCLTMQVYPGASPMELTTDEYFSASARAAAVWSYPTLPGTDIRLTMVAAQDSAGVGYDKRNVIVFRQGTWCRQPSPIGDSGVPEPDCYPSSALAVTSVFKNGKTGEILDTDIEFNAVDYSWGDLVARPTLAGATTADFQNALTHELGHVLGLDHNCYTRSDGQARMNDNTGTPEVDCYNNPTLPQAVAAATMYPSVLLNDTLRRDLTPDDKQGVCDIYPHRHNVCPPRPLDGGCSVLATPSSDNDQTDLLWTAVFFLFASLALLSRRLKRRRPKV